MIYYSQNQNKINEIITKITECIKISWTVCKKVQNSRQWSPKPGKFPIWRQIERNTCEPRRNLSEKEKEIFSGFVKSYVKIWWCFCFTRLGNKENKLRVDDSGSISFQSPPKTFFSLASLCLFYSATKIKHITHSPRYISQRSSFPDNGTFENENREKQVLNIGGDGNRFA